MNPPDTNGDPPFKAKPFFELWCEYNALVRDDPAAQAAGKLWFKLFDGQQELRAKANRNWNVICGLTVTAGFILTLLIAHLFGVSI